MEPPPPSRGHRHISNKGWTELASCWIVASSTSSYSVRGTLFLLFLLQDQNKLTSLYSVLNELRRSNATPSAGMENPITIFTYISHSQEKESHNFKVKINFSFNLSFSYVCFRNRRNRTDLFSPRTAQLFNGKFKSPLIHTLMHESYLFYSILT